jgi:hypothetical protein
VAVRPTCCRVQTGVQEDRRTTGGDLGVQSGLPALAPLTALGAAGTLSS